VQEILALSPLGGERWSEGNPSVILRESFPSLEGRPNDLVEILHPSGEGFRMTDREKRCRRFLS
jgi:hypothetical protein